MTGTKVAHIGVLLGGRDFRCFELLHDETLAETLLNVCGDFWFKHVVKRVPPAPAATERAGKAIAAMFPLSSKTVIEAPAQAEAWASQYIDAKAQEKHFEGLRLHAENHLKLLTGTNAGMASVDWKLSWKNTSSAGVDWKALAAALAGDAGVPGELLKRFTRPGFRRFLVTPSKARARAALAAQAPDDEISNVTPMVEE